MRPGATPFDPNRQALNDSLVSPQWFGGPHTLGFLMTASGLGAVAGALYLASRTTVVGLGRVMMLATLAFGSGLAGVAGVMMSGFKTVFPDMGTPMVVDGFLVVVMGGVGSLLGSVFSAGILGEINGLVAAATNDILARAVVFGVVIAIIVLKPKGLFALKGR